MHKLTVGHCQKCNTRAMDTIIYIVYIFFVENPDRYAPLQNRWLIVCSHLVPYPNPKLQDAQNNIQK